eukprot:4083779-Alexandrium_andersonii.AAC.1
MPGVASPLRSPRVPVVRRGGPALPSPRVPAVGSTGRGRGGGPPLPVRLRRGARRLRLRFAPLVLALRGVRHLPACPGWAPGRRVLHLALGSGAAPWYGTGARSCNTLLGRRTYGGCVCCLGMLQPPARCALAGPRAGAARWCAGTLSYRHALGRLLVPPQSLVLADRES